MSGLTAAKAIKAVIHNKDVAEMLSEDKEIFGAYAPSYEFIVDYYGKHSSVPTISLLEEKFGDDLFDEVPDVDGATRHYLNELRDTYLRDNIVEMLDKVSRAVNKKRPSEVLDAMAAKVADLSKHATRSSDVDITDIEEAIKEFKAIRKDQAEGRGGIMTGLEVWDEYVPGGAQPGQYIVMIGYSSKGKSWMGGKIMSNMYKQGKSVLIISLEMSAKQQRNRIYAMLGQGKFNMRDLQTAVVTDEQLTDFGEDELGTGGKIIVATAEGGADMTPNIIRGKIEKYKPDVVLIDYLQLMTDNSKSREMTPRMMNLSRELKLMAGSVKIPVFAISAVTDDETKKQNTPPTGMQVAWSKGIMYDADIVVANHLYDGTTRMELAARKNRDGELFNMWFEVDLAHGIFTPVLRWDDEED
jgi:replicative DNA helicase